MKISKDVKKGRLFSNCFPLGSKVIGVINRGRGGTGALIQMCNGFYAQFNNGCLITLNQRDVREELQRTCQK